MFLGYSSIIEFLIAAVAVVTSLVLHEWAHAYVALLNGDATAKAYGRLTLNPIKHFDPMGLLMMLVVRFGYAKPVPVNPNNFRRRKLGLITVAFAGVTVNLILAFFSALLTVICLRFNYVAVVYIGIFFRYMCILNVNLALFNLLPLYPLDGFRVIEGATRATNRFTRFLRNYGRYILITLVGINVIIDYFPFPDFMQYFDLLGTYMGHAGGHIVGLFYKFWLLFF